MNENCCYVYTYFSQSTPLGHHINSHKSWSMDMYARLCDWHSSNRTHLSMNRVSSWCTGRTVHKAKTSKQRHAWRHQMETFSALLPFVRGIHRSPVNSPYKSQWRGALMLSLICVWTNGWVNNRDAGDMRRYRAHYDVTVMELDEHERCVLKGIFR